MNTDIAMRWPKRRFDGGEEREELAKWKKRIGKFGEKLRNETMSKIFRDPEARSG